MPVEPCCRPFLRWAGGKNKLLPDLLKRVPTNVGTYHEPFLGGGALFFALNPKQAVLSDANERLVKTYRGVRDDVEEVVSLLKWYDAAYSSAEGVADGCKSFFLAQRAILSSEVDEHWSDAKVAAWFIFLNKTCFNGLYRVNRDGCFNVPHGKSAIRPTICDEANLRACSAALQGAAIVHADFATAALEAGVKIGPGDFLYFDPPYVPASKTSYFTSFTRESFVTIDHERLRDFASACADAGARVLLSNSAAGAPLYTGAEFLVETVSARRSVGASAGSRGMVGEVLVSAGPGVMTPAFRRWAGVVPEPEEVGAAIEYHEADTAFAVRLAEEHLFRDVHDVERALEACDPCPTPEALPAPKQKPAPELGSTDGFLEPVVVPRASQRQKSSDTKRPIRKTGRVVREGEGFLTKVDSMRKKEMTTADIARELGVPYSRAYAAVSTLIARKRLQIAEETRRPAPEPAPAPLRKLPKIVSEDDGDDDDEGVGYDFGPTLDELTAAVGRAGGGAWLTTTASAPCALQAKHAHRILVDAEGSGEIIERDHSHTVKNFVISFAADHRHEFVHPTTGEGDA